MKIGAHEIQNRWLMLISAVLFTGAIFIFLSIPSCEKKPITPQQALNELKIELDKQHAAEIKAKDELLSKKDIIIKEKQAENSILKNKIITSVTNYNILSKKYNDLKEVYANVPLPKTDKELRDRYIAAGFVPAPLGVCGAGYICFSTGYK